MGIPPAATVGRRHGEERNEVVDRPLWQRSVSYGAVGGSQAEDLMSFPPAGYRPYEQRVRIGHGDARWEYAWTTVMSWGIQRNSGFEIEISDSPPAVADQTYVPVSFDQDGSAIPAEIRNADDEAVFGPDGMPYIAPGDTTWLSIPFGPFSVKAPVRVVYVVDEPRRKGFAYGTLPGHPESGEESFIVDQTDDGSVWLTIRAFSRPSTPLWWAVYPALRIMQRHYTRLYFQSLMGAVDQEQGVVEAE
jgi:uncharacterized protein (UPF0548 family)